MRSPTFRYTLPGFFLLSLILPLTDSQTLSSTASGYRISFCHHNSQAQQEKRKTQSDKEPTESQPPSPSPYDLASFIANNPEANLRNTWKQLGIKSVNFGFDDSDDEADHSYVDEFLNRCNDCDVETFSIELDGEQGREVLLRVSDRPSESCRYLLFKQLKHRSRKPEWKLLGHIDHGFGRYRMPQHDIAYGGRRKWLVIKVQGGSGSGFSLYYDRLFQVDSSGLKEVMRFPSEGHIASCCSHPVREFATRIINCDMTNNCTGPLELDRI